MHAVHQNNAAILALAGYRSAKVVRLTASEQNILREARGICQQAMDLRNLDDDSDDWPDCQFRSAAYAIDAIFSDGPWTIA